MLVPRVGFEPTLDPDRLRRTFPHHSRLSAIGTVAPCTGPCTNVRQYLYVPGHITAMSENRIHDLHTLRTSTKATITRAEAAEVLDVDVRTISRAIEDGQIYAIPIGRRVLIPREPFIEMLTTRAEAA